MKEICHTTCLDVKASSLTNISELFVLLIWTSIFSTIGNCILACSMDVTIIAAKSMMLIFAIYGSVGLIYRLTSNLSIAAIFLICYMGLILWFNSPYCLMPLVIMSVVFYGWIMRPLIKINWFNRNVFLCGLFASFLILSTGYFGNFLNTESLFFGSLLHKDTLFHVSIASMLKNYHVASTGLNGLVKIDYYVLSHIVFAALSILAKVSVLDAYGLFQINFFSPLLIFSLAYVVTALPNVDSKIKTSHIWVVICSLLFLSNWLFNNWMLLNAWFTSESYTLALIYFLLLFPMLISKSTFNIKQFLIVICLVTIVTLSKASLGIMILGLMWLRWFFLIDKSEKINDIFPLLLLNLIVYFIVSSLVNDQTQTGLIYIRPLAFIQQYSFGGIYLSDMIGAIIGGHFPAFSLIIKVFFVLLSFFVFHFSISWIVIFMGVRKGGWRACFNDPLVLYPLGAVIAGIFIVMLYRIPGGSVVFFTTVSCILSLPILTSIIIKQTWFNLQYKTIYISLILLMILNMSVFHSGILFSKCFVKLKRPYVNSIILSLLPANGSVYEKYFLKLKTELKTSYDNSLILKLMQLRNKENPGSYIIYDASSVIKQQTGYPCATEPFLYPALSEHAWTSVIISLCEYSNFGYEAYFSDKSKKQLVNLVIPKNKKIMFIHFRDIR